MTRYENWRELAEECRSSGMSVHGWCLEKGIPNSTCRQRIAKLKEEEGRFPKPKEVWGKIQLSETRPDKETPGTRSGAIRILASGLQIELDPWIDPLLLKQILKVVRSVC